MIINTKTIMKDGYRFMQLSLRSEYAYYSVEFTSINEINILSTTSGFIKNKKIFVSNKHEIDIIIDYPIDNNINCVVSSLDKNDNIITYNIIPIEIPIISTKIKPVEIKPTVDVKVSKWKINILIKNDIILEIISGSIDKTYFAFGMPSAELTDKDIIFYLTEDVRSLFIPYEIIETRYKDSDKDSMLACYELIKPTNHTKMNVYHKILVSNTVKVVDCFHGRNMFVPTQLKDPLGRNIK